MELPHDRSHLLGALGTLAVHVSLLAALLSLGVQRASSAGNVDQRLVTVPVDITYKPVPVVTRNVQLGRSLTTTKPSAAASLTQIQIDAAQSEPPPTISGLVEGTGSDPSFGTGEGLSAGTGDAPNGISGSGISPPVRLAGVLSESDYRRANPPLGAEGTVGVRYFVGSDGKVDRCEVIQTSGFAMFDDATCRLIQKRFLFSPARDETGKAVSWEVLSNYRWFPR
jgi:protein TonB